ncbi:MAG: serine hydrolase [Candidatus Marinimicrobia bacterium]|nr:serine hydrolase [Candidatus Neomarinimicrobiota bacterium]
MIAPRRIKTSKYLSFLLIIVSILFLSTCSKPAGIRKINGEVISPLEVDKIVEELMDSANVSGLCLAVLNENKPVNIKTYGFRNIDENLMLDKNSVMPAASFSKAVFSYLVMQLVQERVLEIDKPLYTYLEKPLPEYDNYQDLNNTDLWKQLTARTCLSHTTGFANMRELTGGELKFFFEPGTHYAYSGEGIDLLQFVVEEITGRDIEDLASEKVFNPLGMKRTSYVWQDKFGKNHAVGHNMIGASIEHHKREKAKAGGSLYTTINDYSTFISAVMKKKGLDDDTWDLMLTPSIRIRSKHQFPTLSNEITDKYDPIDLSYGLGWGLFNTEYGRAFFKEGHGNGCQHYNVNFIDQKTSIILMTNSDNGEKIFKYLLENIISDIYTPWEWEDYLPYDVIEPQSIGRYLYDIILFQDIDQAVAMYKEIKSSKMKRYFVFTEGELNGLGYQMIREKKYDAAIKLFLQNVEEFPGSANAYDSLGEAYILNGEIDLAKVSYEKSLELDKNNIHAKEQLIIIGE